MFKKIVAAAMAALTVITVAGCAGKKPARVFTAAELKEAVASARDAEINEYMPIITKDDTEESDMLFEFTRLPADDIEAYAMSVSYMNISAYLVGVIVPKEGKQEAVVKAATAYVESIQKSFESYLPNQYETAKQAIVKVQEDGVVILVMCEDSQTVYDNIVKALTKK